MSQAGGLCRSCGYVLSSLSPHCLGESPWDLERLQQGLACLAEPCCSTVCRSCLVNLCVCVSKKKLKVPANFEGSHVSCSAAAWTFKYRVWFWMSAVAAFPVGLATGILLLLPELLPWLSSNDLHSWPAHLTLLRGIFFNSKSYL